ncbi:cytochrome P450 monooxygenase [Penicillium malachiteum]|uniref:cytochrome P450 monooxygenase n=1 Tax=Penicillium malachiteum TaxID=1324776 RepID=UPI0025477B52|nr:cytochrome P450 monooxygenase [Penicillium malachiteum]KAJ5715763.1 cytochrome P450 monooxygenase [Penicillium malachiteum]
MVILLVAIVALCWKIGPLIRVLYTNWTIAKQLRVPIIITPFVPKSPLWKYVQSLLPVHLPYYLANLLQFTRVMRDNWMYHERYTIYKDYGEVFALVTPTGVEVYIANVEAARQVLTRGRDFPKQIELMGKL